MSSEAFVMPVPAGKDATLEAVVERLGAGNDQPIPSSHPAGFAREVAFLQLMPISSMVIVHRQVADDRPLAGIAGVRTPFDEWLGEALAGTAGVDGGQVPKSQLLIEDSPRGRHRDPYAFAAPVAQGRMPRVFSFADEINTVHRAEFEAGDRRLGVGVQVFLQRSAGFDLLISYMEGTDPAGALGRMLASAHPFDRWHAQQIADLGGFDLTQPPPPPNRLLWDWETTLATASYPHV